MGPGGLPKLPRALLAAPFGVTVTKRGYMEDKSKEIAVRDVELLPNGALPPAAILEAVKTKTKIRLVLDDADIAAAMLERKLNATSVEEMAASDLDDIEKIYSVPFRVVGVGFRNSDEQYAKGEGSLGVWVVLNIATTMGESLTIGTGALDIVVTASKIIERDWLGKGWWVITQSAKETGAGYRPLNMSPAKVDETQAGAPF